MVLNPPFFISSRLMPAIKIGETTIQITPVGRTDDNRVRFKWTIDLVINGEEKTFSSDDFMSGVGTCGTQKAFENLLSFLYAAGESYASQLGRKIDPESNAALFPIEVSEWAYQDLEDISMMGCELEEQKELLVD